MDSFSINGVVQAEYQYNYLGQQAIRHLPQQGVTIDSVFGPDGNRMAEFDHDTGTLLREYVWFDGKPIAVVEGGQVYSVRADHIGRPVFATDDLGSVIWTASYLPFGGVHTSTGDPINLRFPGQWFQSETGLHQNWMRDYDPTTGRYVQADPLGLVDGASVHSYVRSNPMRYVDPRGEFVWFAPIIVGAVVGAGLDLAFQFWTLEEPAECIEWSDIDWWEVGISAAIGGATGGLGRFAYYGYELKIGSKFRIAPFGNRAGNSLGRKPHYHRRGQAPGQGIGRHRPWETKSTDRSFWDRF